MPSTAAMITLAICAWISPESLRRDDGQFALSERVDIHAGGKYRRLTGQDDRAYRIVIIRLPQVTADQLGHLQVDGVLFSGRLRVMTATCAP